ncbi:MAG TPA: hypothetical protein PK771_00320 [Spirochaetota bacterium]|nr:hypothetical protein [Spirochaetota bacterium]
MEDNKNKVSMFAGIITAVVTGLFGTMNLAIQNNNPTVSIILYTLTLISLIMIIVLFILKRVKINDRINEINELITIQQEIDKIHLIRIRYKQCLTAENILFRMNRTILNLFTEALKLYCDEKKIEITPHIERAEPFLYYREILEEINEENKNLLKTTIEQNNFNKLSDKEFERYKEEKFQLFLANAESVRNAKYSDEICIVPMDYLLQKKDKEIRDVCKLSLYTMLDKIREITILEYEAIDELQGKLNTLKQKLRG